MDGDYVLRFTFYVLLDHQGAALAVLGVAGDAAEGVVSAGLEVEFEGLGAFAGGEGASCAEGATAVEDGEIVAERADVRDDEAHMAGAYGYDGGDDSPLFESDLHFLRAGGAGARGGGRLAADDAVRCGGGRRGWRAGGGHIVARRKSNYDKANNYDRAERGSQPAHLTTRVPFMPWSA